MKNSKLKVIAENINDLMKENDEPVTPKQLAKDARLSYYTIAPILRGERDFGITRLLALAEALNLTPNDLLKGTFKQPPAKDGNIRLKAKPKYLISFLTNGRLTRCKFYNVEKNESELRLYPFAIACTKNPSNIFESIRSAVSDICGPEISFEEVFVFVSVIGTEHIEGRKKLDDYGSSKFGSFIIEPDWKAAHNSTLGKQNGIIITINDGYAITYSTDNSKTIHKLQGYSFPIADHAGNLWLGCRAIQHAINVRDGIEKRTLLSDKVLSLVNSDINLLATRAYEDPHGIFIQASALVKELVHREEKSQELIKEGFNNIWTWIKFIDQQTGVKLPIGLAGDLAYLYEEFVPVDRLIKIDLVNETEFDYSMKLLFDLLKKHS